MLGMPEAREQGGCSSQSLASLGEGSKELKEAQTHCPAPLFPQVHQSLPCLQISSLSSLPLFSPHLPTSLLSPSFSFPLSHPPQSCPEHQWSTAPCRAQLQAPFSLPSYTGRFWRSGPSVLCNPHPSRGTENMGAHIACLNQPGQGHLTRAGSCLCGPVATGVSTCPRQQGSPQSLAAWDGESQPLSRFQQ